MHIDYEISEQDHALAQRLALKRSGSLSNRWIFSVFPAFGLVLLAFIAIAIFKRGFSLNVLAGLIVPLGMLSLPILTKRNIRKLYLNSVNLRGPLSLDADDDGMRFQGSTISSQVIWAHFSRYCEDDHSFLLFQNARIFNMIPKRKLSLEQIAELRGLFTRCIARRG
jgi:YcxB-like protein